MKKITILLILMSISIFASSLTRAELIKRAPVPIEISIEEKKAILSAARKAAERIKTNQYMLNFGISDINITYDSENKVFVHTLTYDESIIKSETETNFRAFQILKNSHIIDAAYKDICNIKVIVLGVAHGYNHSIVAKYPGEDTLEEFFNINLLSCQQDISIEFSAIPRNLKVR